ncbi:glucose-6-phosphate isomerase, partial [Francisella tularensis subsp. holarctica]|nr:glucose-6-phosphate isomerase [Francisella tularensis subsp. holarctica]
SKKLADHKVIPVNRQISTILLDDLIQYSLCALIDLYEHKIFFQGVLWDINSYDQWVVELVTKLGNIILKDMNDDSTV